MRATDNLKADHRNIERVLHVMEQAVERLEDGEEIAPATFVSIAEFIQNFADGIHHAKEEERLFPALAKKGLMDEGSPVECMLSEHAYGKACSQAMGQAAAKYADGDDDAATLLMKAMKDYVGLLRHHIYIEDRVLFQLADEVLDAKAQDLLAQELQEASTPESLRYVAGIGALEEAVSD